MLVAPEWLATRLNDPSLVILHVGSERDYGAGHIPGARLVNLADISITGEGGLRLELPPPGALAKALGKLGITDNSRVVVYPGTESTQSATRVWFTLDYAGLGDRASLLDGGLAQWRSEGRPLSTEAPHFAPGEVTVRPRPEAVADSDWVKAHLGDSSVRLLDARTAEFYSGANAGGMPRSGHIPGALSVPYSTLLEPGGRWKSEAALRKALGSNRTVVSYCHIGQQATVLYFAARYLGLSARLYDGSFQDWSARTNLPVGK
jgi:thiosulfate/3-mercaptopyruvate sulfurtransferase